MDIDSVFKPDSIKPIMINIIPGGTMLSPYFLLALHKSPELQNLLEKHEVVFSALFLIIVFAFGLICENLGAHIEFSHWRKIKDKDKEDDWKNYLLESIEEKTIGRQYMHSIVLRMKFEVSFCASIILASPGVIALKNYSLIATCESMLLILFSMTAISAYLIREAKDSVELLADTREILYRNKSAIENK